MTDRNQPAIAAEKARLQLGINLTPDETLTRDLLKLAIRLEKFVCPGDSMESNNVAVKMDVLSRSILRGKYFRKLDYVSTAVKPKGKDLKISAVLTKQVDWTLFEEEVTVALSNDIVGYVLSPRLKDEIFQENLAQDEKIAKIMNEAKKQMLQVSYLLVSVFVEVSRHTFT